MSKKSLNTIGAAALAILLVALCTHSSGVSTGQK